MYTHLWPTHVGIWQKPTPYKAIILNLKINKKEKIPLRKLKLNICKTKFTFCLSHPIFASSPTTTHTQTHTHPHTQTHTPKHTHTHTHTHILLCFSIFQDRLALFCKNIPSLKAWHEKSVSSSHNVLSAWATIQSSCLLSMTQGSQLLRACGSTVSTYGLPPSTKEEEREEKMPWAFCGFIPGCSHNLHAHLTNWQ